MMAPALPQIGEHYGITSPSILNMTLTIFLLAYATGPLFLSPLTEIVGRRWVCVPSTRNPARWKLTDDWMPIGSASFKLVFPSFQPRVCIRSEYRNIDRLSILR